MGWATMGRRRAEKVAKNGGDEEDNVLRDDRVNRKLCRWGGQKA